MEVRMSENKISTVIIDDEKLARNIIRNYINEHPQLEIIAECSNGFEGIKAINELKPEIVFLDIQMPKLNGFEMLELIDEQPVIIFSTAYDEYAVKAFDMNAVDYLLKPYSYERFDEALSRALKRINLHQSDTQNFDKIIEAATQNEGYLNRIVVKQNQKVEIIPVDTVSYLEAQDDYVRIVSEQGKFLKQKTMKYFENHLDPADFVRIHRSYIVSIPEITKIELAEKGSYKAVLSNQSILPVSKTRYSKLKEILE